MGLNYEILNDKPKIGLALGSGGARGLSHIGVIKVLEKHNIPIDFIAGSSIGALIGGFYAATKNIQKIEETASQINWKQLLSLTDPSFHQGILKGERIKKFIKENIGDNFSDLKIPFAAVTTDLKNGKTVILKKGNLVSAIRASIAVPLVFQPIKLENKILSDGGLSMPVPVKAVKEMGATIVIAVNLDGSYFDKETKTKLSFYEIANTSLNILRYHLAFYNAKEADFVITPKVGGITWFDFVKRKEKTISLGEKATEEKIDLLKALIKKRTYIGLKKYFDFLR